MNFLYNNQAPLFHEQFPHLHWKVGVTVSRPYFSKGSNQTVVQIDSDRPEMNGVGSRGWYPAETWKEQAHENTVYIISKIDAMIKELQGHRDRLEREAEALEKSIAG